MNLRNKTRVCYYEPEEPAPDEYIYCDKCTDYVYEYCCIHGPLLVVPDDEVPANTGLPSYVPRSALTIPHVFLHLAPSIIPGAGLGVFTTLTLPRGVRFGPYRGKRTQLVESSYCWQIYDRDNKPSHAVDASDANSSNWMRYVNCSRHWCEQNLVAYQYCGEIYYRTIKVISKYTELMVFYGSEFANTLHIDLTKYNTKVWISPYNIIVGQLNEANKYASNRKSINKIIEEQYNTVDVHEYENTNNKCNTNYQINNCDILLFDEKYIANNSVNRENGTEETCMDINPDVFNEDNKTEVTFKIDNKTNIHQLTNTYTCKECSKSYTSRNSYRRHTLKHLKIKKYQCIYCEYKTNFKYIYDNHMNVHSKKFLYQCKFCNYVTFVKNNYRNHNRRTHKLTTATIRISDNVI